MAAAWLPFSGSLPGRQPDAWAGAWLCPLLWSGVTVRCCNLYKGVLGAQACSLPKVISVLFRECFQAAQPPLLPLQATLEKLGEIKSFCVLYSPGPRGITRRKLRGAGIIWERQGVGLQNSANGAKD